MSKNEQFKEFNKKYFDFLLFIQKYLNNDPNFKTFYRKNQIIRETNDMVPDITLFMDAVVSKL